MPRNLEIPIQNIAFQNAVQAERFLCGFCDNLLRQPFQLPCGHRLCDKCFSAVNNEEEFRCCPVITPEPCNKSFEETKVFLDNGLLREILDAVVCCYNHDRGCKFVDQLKLMERHIASDCEWRSTDCTFKPQGCEKNIPYKELQTHISGYCDYAPVSCAFCKDSVLRGEIKDHHEHHCPEIPINCSRDCGVKVMKRSDMEKHAMECNKRLEPCQYSLFGCRYEGTKSDLDQHENESSQHHLRLSLHAFKDALKQKNETSKEMSKMLTENNELKLRFSAICEDLKSVKSVLGIKDSVLRPSRSLPNALSILKEETRPAASSANSLAVPRTKPRSRKNSSNC